jgi:plasmid stabilization system protein ParE
MPSKVVEFQEEALLDYESASQWYLARSYTAASKFTDEIGLAIERIAEHPQRWPSGAGGTRKLILQHFPFVVIYRELAAKILIVAIAHGKRRPGYWKERH